MTDDNRPPDDDRAQGDGRTPYDDRGEEPTAAKPLHGERRPALKPFLITVAVFAVLIVLYLLGAQYLVPAD